MVEPRIVLRQRICRCASCRKLFHICRPCDRGHGYCSQACRLRQRRQQCRAANRRPTSNRHQQSLPRVEPIIGTDNEPTESGYAQPA